MLTPDRLLVSILLSAISANTLVRREPNTLFDCIHANIHFLKIYACMDINFFIEWLRINPEPILISGAAPTMEILLNGPVWRTPSMSASLQFKYVLIVLHRNIYPTDRDKSLQRRVDQLLIHIKSSLSQASL